MMKKNIIFVITLLSFFGVQAQDLHFSQPLQTPLLVNPGNAGLGKTDYRGIMNYRSQWKSFGSPYKTMLLNFDGKLLEKDNGILSFGLVVHKDNSASIYKSTGASLIGAYDLYLTDHSGMSFGLGVGFNQLRFSLDDRMWGSQYDGSGYNGTLPGDLQEANFAESDGVIDLSSGIVWHYSKGNRNSFSNDNLRINAGLSGYHLNQPVYDLSGLSGEPNHRRLVFFGNAFIGINNKNIAVIPSFVTQFSGGSKEFLLGTLIRYTMQQASKVTGINREVAFSVGGNLRLGDAFAPVLNLEYGNLGLGMSYDMNLSQLRESTKGRGGFEVSLKYMLDRAQ